MCIEFLFSLNSGLICFIIPRKILWSSTQLIELGQTSRSGLGDAHSFPSNHDFVGLDLVGVVDVQYSICDDTIVVARSNCLHVLGNLDFISFARISICITMENEVAADVFEIFNIFVLEGILTTIAVDSFVFGLCEHDC
jgi:hypothetical protein